MDKSKKIDLYVNYMTHPLREQYESKRKKILEKKPPIVKISYLIQPVAFILIFVYGYIFFEKLESIEIGGFLIGILFLLFFIGLGIINLIFAIAGFMILDKWRIKKCENYNKKQLKELDESYKKKGLKLYTIDELYSGSCCEFLDYPYERFVCSVTKDDLSYTKVMECDKSNSCSKCEIFLENLSNRIS